jgi:O-antigen/teichoic acid export membrane protein
VNREKYITAVLRLGGLAGLAYFGWLSPVTATLAMVLSPIMGGLAYLSLVRSPHSLRAEPVGPVQLLGYSSRVWLGSLSGILLTRVSQVIMTPLAGPYELGLYAVAVNIADIVLITNAAIRDVIFSSDARDRDNGRAYVAARISLLTSLVIATVLGSTVVAWLPVVFGIDFTPAIPATVVLILATVIGVPGSIGGAVLSARGKPELRSAALVVSVVVNIGLLVILVPRLGAVGASLAILAGNFVAANLNLLFLRRHFGMKISSFYTIRMGDIKIVLRVAKSLFRR